MIWCGHVIRYVATVVKVLGGLAEWWRVWRDVVVDLSGGGFTWRGGKNQQKRMW